MDLSILATPAYFGSMAYEHRALKRRAVTLGPTAADYTKPDTVTSLSMGVASLLVPVTQFALSRIAPGRLGRRSGRAGNVLVAVTAGAAVVTTVADRVARRAAARTDRATEARARRVAGAGGVVAVAAGGLVATSVATVLSSVQRQWTRKGSARDLGTGLTAWLTALAGWDLIYYLNHRLQHEVRGLWAIHVVHHSSERYNLSTALRQPVSAFGVFVPYGLLSRIGVRPPLVEHARGINLLYQFWIHTDAVRSLGRSEAVLNSPSHHRVHHGSNQRYLDRNHAGILIVWDRLLGTFQPELPDDDAVVYGLTKNINTYNPLRVMTHEYRDMFADVRSSTNWHDRLSYVLRGPGWAYRKREERTAGHNDSATPSRAYLGASIR